MAFPVLSRAPFAIDEAPIDMVLRSPTDAGYEMTRPRFTKQRLSWSVKYRNLSQADKDSVDSFWAGDAAFGSVVFVWTHPTSSVAYNVRFSAIPEWSTDINKHPSLPYDLTFDLREA